MIGRRNIEQEFSPKDVLLFTMIGEKSYVDYLKARIEVISTKCPPELLNVEFQYP